MRRLSRFVWILASCVLLAGGAPGCADEQLNPQPLPPGKNDSERGGSNTGQEPGADPGAPARDSGSGELCPDGGDGGDGGNLDAGTD